MEKEMKLQPVKSQMRLFKQYFHGPNPTYYQVYSKKEGLRERSEKKHGKLTKQCIEQLVTANIEGMSIAMMINEGVDRKSDGVTRITAFYCDFDRGGMTKKELLALPIKPHLIVETSPGKFHVYWLIVGCPIEAFPRAMRALAAEVGSDPNVSDLPRVMRMAGTYNHKHEPPFLVNIVHRIEKPKPIAFEEFRREMKLKISGATTKPKRDVIANQTPISENMRTEIKEALACISPENRDEWLKVGMAIHDADPSDIGRGLWIEWARQSAKFDEAEHLKMWNKFKPDGGVTINTLFSRAKLAKRAEQLGYDEAALAKLFAENFKDRLRYCPGLKKWLWFNGVVWTDAQPQLAHQFAREMVTNLAAENDSNTIRGLNRFETVAGYRSITSHAELLPELQIDVSAFDRDPNLLALKNGVVDLATGNFREATPADLLRRQANVEYDAAAKARGWIKFLKKVTCADKELYFYIRRAIGYILFGRADLQLFFLIIGSGGNGKGVLMRTLKTILGDYATNVPPNLLTTAYSGNVNAPSPALAKLEKARYVICTELKPGKLEAAFLKQFAGGDEITARHTYGDTFTFKPEGKLVISANHSDLPEIAADDEAMWRRLIPIPFNAEFVKGENDDTKLEERLTAEFSGILNWMLKGAVSYNKMSLGTCAAVENTKDKLRKDADSLLSWMSECCIEKANLKTPGSTAYANYLAFMSHKEKKPVTVQAFKSGLSRKGFQHKQTSKNNVYVGFGLR